MTESLQELLFELKKWRYSKFLQNKNSIGIRCSSKRWRNYLLWNYRKLGRVAFVDLFKKRAQSWFAHAAKVRFPPFMSIDANGPMPTLVSISNAAVQAVKAEKGQRHSIIDTPMTAKRNKLLLSCPNWQTLGSIKLWLKGYLLRHCYPQCVDC